MDDTPNGPPDPFATVRVDIVKPGRVQEYIALMKDVVQTYKQMGKVKSMYLSRTRYGGNAYEFHGIVGYGSLADISSTNEFQKTMGEAKYAVFLKKLGEVLDSSQVNLVRYRPEFSYMPAAQ